MKKMFFTLLLSSFCAVLFAQSHTAPVEYQKVIRQAVVNEIPFPEKTVRNAIDDKMQKAGYKGKDSKGFTVYKGVRLTELGTEAYDLYFMVDRKSKKEKETAVLTLLISKGFDAFVSDSADAPVINSAKKYLDSIKDMIAAYDLELQIADQGDAVKKADKKLNNLRDDGIDMEKRRKKLEQQIEDNKKDQTAQEAEIDKQRQILQTLIGKRKG